MKSNPYLQRWSITCKDGLPLKSVPTSKPGLTSAIGGRLQNPSHPGVESPLGMGRGLVVEIFEHHRPTWHKHGCQLRNQYEGLQAGSKQQKYTKLSLVKSPSHSLAICSYFPVSPLPITVKYLPKTGLHFLTTRSFFFLVTVLFRYNLYHTKYTTQWFQYIHRLVQPSPQSILEPFKYLKKKPPTF